MQGSGEVEAARSQENVCLSRRAYESTSLHMAALISHPRCWMIELRHACCPRRGGDKLGQEDLLSLFSAWGGLRKRENFRTQSTTSPFKQGRCQGCICVMQRLTKRVRRATDQPNTRAPRKGDGDRRQSCNFRKPCGTRIAHLI